MNSSSRLAFEDTNNSVRTCEGDSILSYIVTWIKNTMKEILIHLTERNKTITLYPFTIFKPFNGALTIELHEFIFKACF